MSDLTPPPPAAPYQTAPPAGPTPYGLPPYSGAGAVGYGQVPGQPYYWSTKPPTNSVAIIALILGFVMPLGGIIAGHIALGQIKRTGEGGRGMALAGAIIGYVYMGFLVLYFVFIAVVMSRYGMGGSYYY
jgi:hypothetical protein